MRKKLVMGNWKMNKSVWDSCEFIEEIYNQIDTEEADVVVCPTFLALSEMATIFEEFGGEVMLGAQNMHFAENGAYTGEVAADMLAELGVTYVIIGHSERRQYFSEINETVNKKVNTALEHGIIPVMCVGESLEQREKGETFDFIQKQIKEGLNGIEKEAFDNIVIAYEPIWAIGTGKTASAEQAEEVCKFIRGEIEKLYGKEVSDVVRILYGGSVKASNAKELFTMPNIDGGLVGGASLEKDFIEIVNAAK